MHAHLNPRASPAANNSNALETFSSLSYIIKGLPHLAHGACPQVALLTLHGWPYQELTPAEGMNMKKSVMHA